MPTKLCRLWKGGIVIKFDKKALEEEKKDGTSFVASALEELASAAPHLLSPAGLAALQRRGAAPLVLRVTDSEEYEEGVVEVRLARRSDRDCSLCRRDVTGTLALKIDRVQDDAYYTNHEVLCEPCTRLAFSAFRAAQKRHGATAAAPPSDG